MARFLDTVRSGAWLTGERMRLVAIAVLVAGSAGLIFLATTAHGVVDFKGRPLGTDFSSFYAAGTLALEGHTVSVYNVALHYAREQALFGPATPYYAWFYPPFFLLPMAALALLPYVPALLLWEAASFAGYLLAMRALIREAGLVPHRLWLLLATAFPPVLINFGHGQNGLLSAALLSGALALLPRLPLAAGVLFGLMAYKPQFGLLIPLALFAGGNWRAILAAVATIALLMSITTAVLGIDVWQAFLVTSRIGRSMLIESGDVSWYKMQSVFALARMWGCGVYPAFAVQSAITVSVAVALAWLWHGRAAFTLKAAALAIGCVLATPFSLDYDLMLLAPAVACLAAEGFARGFAPWEKSLLAVLWIVPLIGRGIAESTLIPLAVPAMLAAFALSLHRAMSESSTPRASGILSAAP